MAAFFGTARGIAALRLCCKSMVTFSELDMSANMFSIVVYYGGVL